MRRIRWRRKMAENGVDAGGMAWTIWRISASDIGMWGCSATG